jgi:hypothetical protein
MPKIQQWAKFREALRRHLIERISDRSISLTDLNQLRLWVEANPEVPVGDWYKDFGSFKLRRRGISSMAARRRAGSFSPKMSRRFRIIKVDML